MATVKVINDKFKVLVPETEMSAEDLAVVVARKMSWNDQDVTVRVFYTTQTIPSEDFLEQWRGLDYADDLVIGGDGRLSIPHWLKRS